MSNKFNLPISIPCSSSCNSTNCIYIIKCVKCNLLYIGQTSRTISIRLKEHLAKIKYAQNLNSNNHNQIFQNFLVKNQDCYNFYKHFSLNHNINKDLNFQIFVSNCNFYRLRLETDLIILFNTIFPGGLNSNFSNYLNSIQTYTEPPLKQSFII